MQLRRGIFTSEFLVTVLTDIGVVLASITGNLSPKWAALAATGSTVAYTLARAITKHGFAAAAGAGTTTQ